MLAVAMAGRDSINARFASLPSAVIVRPLSIARMPYSNR